jgi:hypothetical protein
VSRVLSARVDSLPRTLAAVPKGGSSIADAALALVGALDRADAATRAAELAKLEPEDIDRIRAFVRRRNGRVGVVSPPQWTEGQRQLRAALKHMTLFDLREKLGRCCSLGMLSMLASGGRRAPRSYKIRAAFARLGVPLDAWDRPAMFTGVNAGGAIPD